MISEIKTVAVIGAGTMGQGIAQVCAAAGFQVSMFDVNPSSGNTAKAKIEASLQSLVEKNKISVPDKNAAVARLHVIEKMEDVRCDIAIEAAAENLEIKRKIFSQLEKTLPAHAVLTSNTSSIPITQIAVALGRPSRFAGLHFFNPAPVMKLVEIIKGAATTEETVILLEEFCVKLAKQSVRTQDSPGFIVNRVARHYYVEALKVVEENVASFSTVDSLLRATGFKMGPFELMDLIGIDVNFAVTSSIYHAFHQDSKFRPSRIQQQKVDAGQLGRKSGQGFYDYNKQHE
ncbi:MAG TPA: 3-hydroxyacyl-CoA dehydrogenase NAD-binding domain-containing protein [Chryseosolibacter sp.]